GAAEQLAEALEDVRFNDAVIPVVQNVNAEAARDADTLKANLLKQLYSPVLWTDSVRALTGQGVEVAVECGAGKVLAGLIKRIERGLTVHSIEDQDALAGAMAAFGKSE
ncbi:MAG: malonyl CoA-acyl carrier protein transacylase, partial [Marinobacter sp. 34-60-7]